MFGQLFPGSGYFGGFPTTASLDVTGVVDSTQSPNISASIGDVETGVHGFLTWERPKKIKRKRSVILARKKEEIPRFEIKPDAKGQRHVEILPSLLVTPEGKVIEATKISDLAVKSFERKTEGRVSSVQSPCISEMVGYIGAGDEEELMLIMSFMED